MKKTPELHLFIIWNKALYKKNEIFKDIQENFNHTMCIDVFWDSEMYVDNLKRFYLNEGRVIINKVKHIQKGDFCMILVSDQNPNYELRNTTSGKKEVNKNIFDLKKKYRLMTGGGHKIHGTDSIEETKHQVFFLLGKYYDEINKQLIENKKITALYNPIWSFEIKTIDNIFEVLNHFSQYVVLRNYESIDDNYHDSEHNDIDILIDQKSFPVIKSILNLKKVFIDKNRVHYKTYVNNQIVYFDFRFIGDGYYDEKWEENILGARKKHGSFYIPDENNYKFSLLYHALIHKKSLSDDYKSKLYDLFQINETEELYNTLNRFMLENEYVFTEPDDYSVYFNFIGLKGYLGIDKKVSVYRMANKSKRIISVLPKKLKGLFLKDDCLFCSKR